MSKGFKFVLGLMIAFGVGFWLFFRYFVPNCDRTISEPRNSDDGRFFAYTDRNECRGGRPSRAQLLLGKPDTNEKYVVIAVSDSGDDIDFEWHAGELIVTIPDDAKFEQPKVFEGPVVRIVRD
jgi:hypothetical protein